MSSFGRPVCSVAEWVPHSVVFASGVDSVCVPLANEGVGLGPSSSGPVASRPPLGIGLLRRPRGDAFHLAVSMRWSSTHGGLASGSSGSQASRYGLLVSVQGASVSMPHSSPEGDVVASGFWYGRCSWQRPFLLAWMSPWRRVGVCPSLPFTDYSLSLRFLF